MRPSLAPVNLLRGRLEGTILGEASLKGVSSAIKRRQARRANCVVGWAAMSQNTRFGTRPDRIGEGPVEVAWRTHGDR